MIHLKKADFGFGDRDFYLHLYNRLEKFLELEGSVVIVFKGRVVWNSFSLSNLCDFFICLNCKLAVNCRYISIHRSSNWVVLKSVQVLIISRLQVGNLFLKVGFHKFQLGKVSGLQLDREPE